MIGKLAEIKNTTYGKNFFAKHYCYIANATIGDNCNVGAGVVVAYYDGKEKHKTVIGDNVFIGANVTIVPPVTIGDNVYIAAGTIVRKDIPSNSFVYDKREQMIVENDKQYRPEERT